MTWLVLVSEEHSSITALLPANIMDATKLTSSSNHVKSLTEWVKLIS